MAGTIAAAVIVEFTGIEDFTFLRSFPRLELIRIISLRIDNAFYRKGFIGVRDARCRCGKIAYGFYGSSIVMNRLATGQRHCITTVEQSLGPILNRLGFYSQCLAGRYGAGVMGVHRRNSGIGPCLLFIVGLGSRMDVFYVSLFIGFAMKGRDISIKDGL